MFSKWFGESEETLRRIFEDARQRSPSIVFFDEIDSVATQRAESHEASRRVVAQLLTLMDGFESNSNVIVIAATNRPQDIDVALRRPGRFDWEIEFALPTLDDRELILRTSAGALHTTGAFLPIWLPRLRQGWLSAELTAIWSEGRLLWRSPTDGAIYPLRTQGGGQRVSVELASAAREVGRARHREEGAFIDCASVRAACAAEARPIARIPRCASSCISTRSASTA